MAWQTPKTDWDTIGAPGPGDFNRIEGNEIYLKEQTDGLKDGSIPAAKANYATSAGNANYATSAGNANYATSAGNANYATSAGNANYATSAGNANYANGSIYISGPHTNLLISSDTERAVSGGSYVTLKRIRLAYPGVYRATFESRVSEYGTNEKGYVHIFLLYSNILMQDIQTFIISSYSYQMYDINFQVFLPEAEIYIQAHHTTGYQWYVYVRNLRIYGTNKIPIMTAPAVIQD